MSEEKAAIQEQLDSRLRSLSKQQAAPAAGTTVKQAGAGRSPGYGLIAIILVALLAFIIGQFTQNAMPELIEKFHELKAKYTH